MKYEVIIPDQLQLNILAGKSKRCFLIGSLFMCSLEMFYKDYYHTKNTNIIIVNLTPA